MEKIAARINSWATKKLSFAGRVQLIQHFLFGIQVCWTSDFIFPAKLIKDVEKLFNSFLWSGSDRAVHMAKVAWTQVCLPTMEGGLGLKRVREGLE